MNRRDLIKAALGGSAFTVTAMMVPMQPNHVRLVNINVTSGVAIREEDLAKSAKELSTLLDKELAEVKRALMFGFACCAREQLHGSST